MLTTYTSLRDLIQCSEVTTIVHGIDRTGDWCSLFRKIDRLLGGTANPAVHDSQEARLTMQVKIEKLLDDYIRAGDETTQEILKDSGYIVVGLRRHHDFFAKELWSEPNGLGATAAFMSMNAFMLLLSAFRIALTGHAVAIFPLLRTALESSCYAYLVFID